MPNQRGRGRGIVYVFALLLLAAGGIGVSRLVSRGPSTGSAPATEGTAARGGAARLGGGTSSTPEDPSAGLEPGALEGIVLDADGAPVDGAQVALTRTWRRDDPTPPGPVSPIRASAVTAGGGRFRFADLPPAEYGVNALAPGALPGHGAPVTVASGGTAKVEIRLGRGGLSLSGRVLDAGGGTVPGARLVFSEWGGGRPDEPPRTLAAQADAAGAFRVSLGRATYGVTVEAAGYATAQEQVTLARATVRDFRLAPGARVSGRVVERGTRAPVADAEVSLGPGERPIGPFSPRSARTDGSGAFALAELEAGTYQVTARKGRLAGTAAQLVTLGLAQTVSDVEIEVAPAHQVSGRVLAAGESRGIEGARVSLFSQEGITGRSLYTKSGPDGAFVVEGVLAGRYSLNADAEGYGRAGKAVPVTAGDARVDIELARGALVSGRVLDAAGKPVEAVRVSANVEARGPVPVMSMDAAVTKTDGTFELKRLAGGGDLHLAAQQEGGGVAAFGPEPVAPGERKTVTLTLGRGSFVSGTVRHADGTAAADVRVGAMVRESRLGGGSSRYATTDAEGNYRLGPLTKGTVSVSADRRGRVSWRFGSDPPNQQTFSLGDGEDKAGVDLVVEKGGQSISGQLVAPDGRPVGLATIMAGLETNGRASRGFRAEKTFTTHDGQFTLGDLQSGAFTLWAVHPDYPDAELKGVAAGSKGVKLQLPRDTSVAGVVTAKDGKPVADFTVTAVAGPAAGETPDQKRRRLADTFDKPSVRVHDPAGAFRLRRLAAGSYELLVAAPDGRAGTAVVSVQAGEQRTGVRVTLESGVRVTGRVVELEGGAPIAGATARVFGPANARVEATTGPDGAFTLENAPADSVVRLSVSGERRTHVAESKEIEVRQNAATVDAGVIKLMRGDYGAKMEAPDRGETGLFVGLVDGVPRVRSLQKDGAAEKAGALRGDRVVAVDGKPAGDMGSGALNYVLLGKAGTSVTVTLETPGSSPRTLTLPREPPRRPGP